MAERCPTGAAFPEELRYVIKENIMKHLLPGETHSEFAGRMDVHPETISKITRLDWSPKAIALIHFSKKLGVSIEELLHNPWEKSDEAIGEETG